MKTLLFLGMSLLVAVGQAATVTWSATPASGNWSVGANWAGGTPPNPGDDLVFPATSTIQGTTNDLASGIAINSITFNGNGYRLAGNSITLAHFGIRTTSASPPATNAVSLPITITDTNNFTTFAAVQDSTLTFSGAISGAGGLDLEGASSSGTGTFVLSGIDPYTGGTLVECIAYVDGTLSGTSAVVVPINGTVGGTGTIANQVQISSTASVAFVFPGHGSSPGILSTGGVTFDGLGFVVVRINGPTVGTEYSQLNVNGAVTLGTNCILEIASLGFVPAHGTQFTIIKNNGGSPVSGTFSGLPEGATFVVGSTTFQISYVGGSGHDVVLTVISPWVPTALAVDAGGNGVLEAGELATLQPTWMNSSGSSSTLTGATTNFTGPAGPTYSNPAASGNYGSINNGASAQCATCYSVEVTGTRPVQHWDATIDETVTPTSTKETWVLHVGESFPDVPTSQQFYTLVYQLASEIITGGCGGGNYCPGNPVTRGQMSVFLLKAEHGGAYSPPACSATVFADVVCPGAQFVNFINQLAAENITGGCGGGNYCPGNPNNRGQMAVFLVKTFGLLLYGP